MKNQSVLIAKISSCKAQKSPIRKNKRSRKNFVPHGKSFSLNYYQCCCIVVYYTAVFSVVTRLSYHPHDTKNGCVAD